MRPDCAAGRHPLTAGQRAEALLPRRVPHGEADPLAPQLDDLGLEVDPDGGDQLLKPARGKAKQQARLAHAAVAHQQDLHRGGAVVCAGQGAGAVNPGTGRGLAAAMVAPAAAVSERNGGSGGNRCLCLSAAPAPPLR